MKEEETTHTIDAKGKSPGRLAASISTLLQGKHKPGYVPYKISGDVVKVQNIRDMRITGRKEVQKMYYRHSGYLGNLKQESLGKLYDRKPDEVLKKAVMGMLPKNKLRKEWIKRLKIES